MSTENQEQAVAEAAEQQEQQEQQEQPSVNTPTDPAIGEAIEAFMTAAGWPLPEDTERGILCFVGDAKGMSGGVHGSGVVIANIIINTLIEQPSVQELVVQGMGEYHAQKDAKQGLMEMLAKRAAGQA